MWASATGDWRSSSCSNQDGSVQASERNTRQFPSPVKCRTWFFHSHSSKKRKSFYNCTRQSIFPSYLPPTLTNEARPITSLIIITIFKPWMFHVSLKKKTNIQIPCIQQLWQLQPYLATSLEETNNYKSCIASKKLSAWNKSWKESKWHAPLIPVILPVVLNICKLRNC